MRSLSSKKLISVNRNFFNNQFYRSSNPTVHTQAIEGTWFRVKRWLPTSGRYQLEYYLPVYLWNQECKRAGVSPFWKLLEIISVSDAAKLFGLETEGIETQVQFVVLLSFIGTDFIFLFRSRK